MKRIVRRFLVVMASAFVVAVILAVAVFPTRTYLEQRRELAATEQRIELLAAENKRLEARVRKLHTDAEIERIAREQYSLVRPGEEAYAVLPAPGDPAPRIEQPRVQPPRADRRSLWERVKDAVTFWS